MLNQDAIGLTVEEIFRYSWRDTILYNLSVGARPEELDFLYEEGLKVVPTYAAVPCVATFGVEPHRDRPVMPTSLIEGMPAGGFLHLDHCLTLHRPLAVEGTIYVKKRISAVYDWGDKGAKILVDITGSDASGHPIFTNTMGYLKQGCGNFGGPPAPHLERTIPERAPDLYAEDLYPLTAALLYRLNGDTFPLHADPKAARESGFDRPIVHGLCSLGYACRLLASLLIPGEPERVTQIETQFRSPALPGSSFVLLVWNTQPGEAMFRMIDRQSGKPILDRGRICWT